MVPQPNVVATRDLGGAPALLGAVILLAVAPVSASAYRPNYDAAPAQELELPNPPAIFPFQNYRQSGGFDTEFNPDYRHTGGSNPGYRQSGGLDTRMNPDFDYNNINNLEPASLQLSDYNGRFDPDADEEEYLPLNLRQQIRQGQVQAQQQALRQQQQLREQIQLQEQQHNSPVQQADDPPPSANSPTSFPELSFKQKQFAVNPASEEFYQTNPNFLKFRLEESEQGGDSGLKVQEDDGLDSEKIKEQDYLDEQDPQAKRARMGVASPLRWDGLAEETKDDDLFFTVAVAASTAFAVFGIVGAGYCYRRNLRQRLDSEEVEYPSYGVTGPAKDASPASGDRKLAQSAQMYHYQHQKSQMIGSGGVGAGNLSEGEETEGEEGEGDYTVYECPGLASTDEMEVKNPLFDYDPTPKP